VAARSEAGPRPRFPGNLTVYAASKAGVSALAEGIRAEALGTAIRVSTLLPGYIRSESNPHVGRVRLVADTENGCRLLVRAIERERPRASVPAWPWSVLGLGLRALPLRVTAKFGGAAQRSRDEWRPRQ
jgi:short-subunit dehydrogenase